jgi:hypothetical protein
MSPLFGGLGRQPALRTAKHMNPFMLLIGPMYQVALLIITFLVTATYAVTDKFAMIEPDGSEQAQAYYVEAQGIEGAQNGRPEKMLIVQLPSGEIFTTLDPREILTSPVEGAAPAAASARHFALASDGGARMDCAVAGAEEDGTVDSARCATRDGRVFEFGGA